MKKNLLWPTEIYSFKTEIIDNDKIKEIILKKEKDESSKSISNIGGWQSEEALLEKNDFSEIKDFLFECFSSIKNEIYREDVKLSLVQSWANVNRYGHYNVGHVHGGSHWSCSYYVTETYTAPLYFIDPRVRVDMDNSHFFLKNKYFNTLGSEKSMPGEVIFFPSWLEHAVSVNSTNNPRISIACNFLIEG
jgi:uncharacterized protein (TIGR02466 family)|tara:strand:+ start:214 stop:786 length:573 start_codon:yes stop_codon:yes gene_type:complete